MTRKLYREYYKDFELDGLKWREVYVTFACYETNSSLRRLVAVGQAPPFSLAMKRLEDAKIIHKPASYSIQIRRLRGKEEAVTCIFKVPLDNETAVYWAMSNQYQDDATVLADLKTALS